MLCPKRYFETLIDT